MITKELFGKKPCGCEVYAYTLTNKNGASVKILTMGGILQQLNIPDRDGKLADVICGFDTVDNYLNGGGYQGALIGRYGNRIANGRFTLNGVTYQLAQNSGISNHLHGGNVGFNQKIWDAVPFEKADECGLIMTMTSPDGEENYPGKLDVKVTYTFTDANELKIHYEAETDKDTIVNMTNHSYFNLGGYDSGLVLDQELWVDSDSITEVDENLISTGKEYAVKGTAFDFNTPTKIGARIETDDVQLAFGGGYDHNYNLKTNGKSAKVAELYDPKSGRVMSVITDQPGVQVYAGNQMGGDVPFKGGIKQVPRSAICLETQHAPDSPNHPNFPTTTLKAGEKYDTTTVYAFSVR
ncbi:MAG: galactose mutarotase [Clostridiales bacterium]|nr:galactose mutarotase [Clostridiales bacterium]